MALSLLHSKPYMPKKKKKKKEPEVCTMCALVSKDVALPVGDREGNPPARFLF